MIQFLKSRTTKALDSEISNTLRVDKLLVESAARNSVNCSNLPIGPCVEPIDLNDKYGRRFLSSDGSQKIGAWNVRLGCGVDKTFWIQISRQRKDKSFDEDPLTKKPLQWADLVKLDDSCVADARLVLEKTCYGYFDGKTPLPKEIVNMSKGDPPPFNYCLEDQIAYPQCPDGYALRKRYSDRFGWGGIDIVKYSNCEKIK